MIEDIDKTLQAIQDIAMHLSWNLHTGASENIISSLLAASINHSDDFKDCFLDLIGFSKENRKQLYAAPNMNINRSIVKAIQKRKLDKLNIDDNFPERPDIVICDEKLDRLEEIEGRNNLGDALRDSPLVIIEVKHTKLNGDDKKYQNLIKGLKFFNKKHKNKLLKRHRFVIISSHTPKAKTNIIDGKGKNSEKTWCYFFTSEAEGVKHFTLREIYEEIQEINKHNTEAKDKCCILQMFEYYLAIHLGIIDLDKKLHNEYWEQVIKHSGSVFNLKWEIAGHINWLAGNASVKTERKRREEKTPPSWHEDKAGTLRKIEFKRNEKNGSTVRFEYNKKRCKHLYIVLDDYFEKLNEEKMNNYREIIKILEKVIEFMEN